MNICMIRAAWQFPATTWESVYEMKEDTAAALKFYKQSLGLSTGLHDSTGMSYSMENVAGIYLLQKKYEPALQLLKKAVDIREKTGDKNALAITLNNIGEVYLEKKEYSNAISYFNKSLSISTAIGYKDLSKHTSNLISQAFFATGDYKKAFEYQQTYAVLKDSLYNESMQHRITELNTKYETEKKEKEIGILSQKKKENELKILEQDLEISSKQITILMLIASVALLLTLGLAIYFRIKSKQREILATERAKQQQTQLKMIIETQEKERKRIAEDLHDGIGQMLAGIRMNLSSATAGGTELLPDKKEVFLKSVETLDQACAELRTLSHQMMPKALTKHGLVSALEDLFSIALGGSKIKYSFSHAGEMARITDIIEINSFRVMQEILSNIIKHSGATEINAQLMFRNQTLVIIVEDNGKGFDKEQALRSAKGMGLSNIYSRVQSLNGAITFSQGSESKGTLVTIRIPLNGAN